MKKNLILLAVMLCSIVALGDYSWNQPQAQISATGDLSWAPQTYSYSPGSTVRYIDFENGDDSNSGTSTSNPWKHHPWDTNATGNAQSATNSGIDTYVFKGGVIYRGTLIALESGTPSNPIRLCSDPSWGVGKASIWGSERITNGWTRGDAASVPGVADPTNVWYQDIGTDIRPKALWWLDGTNVTRVALAREPDWQIDHEFDIHTQWYEWEGVVATNWVWNGTTYSNKWYGIDTQNLTATNADFYNGSHIWSEVFFPPFGNMDTDTIHPVYGYYPELNAIYFGELFQKGQRYYLENKLDYIDDAQGEFYYSDPSITNDNGNIRVDFYGRNPATTVQNPGRLYVRLPGDANPNGEILEVPARHWPVQIYNQSDIIIEGLDFRYDDTHIWATSWYDYFFQPCVVRVIGDCRRIRVSNCDFYHITGAMCAFPRPTEYQTYRKFRELHDDWTTDLMDEIEFCDNDVQYTDRQGVKFANPIKEHNDGALEPVGRFRFGRIMRNRFYHIAFRPGHSLTDTYPSIAINSIERVEIAGNMIDYGLSAGIDAIGGKPGGAFHDIPLRRYLIYNNKVSNCMLGQNDYGGIETWQGGPFYVYNNKSGNLIGFKNNRYTESVDNGDDPLDDGWLTQAPAYYLDGSYKNFFFNNIAWGHDGSMTNKYRTRMAFNMVLGFMNNFFNNTSYDFMYGITGSAGDRNSYLANVLAGSSQGSIDLGRSGDLTVLGGGGGDTSAFIASLSLGYNVYNGPHENEMVSINNGDIEGNTIEELELSIAAHTNPPRLAHAGWLAESLPLQDPENHDFRLADNTPALDTGVKFFVPWALYKTVGEWNFYQDRNDPERVISEAFNMTDEYKHRDMYYDVPLLNLEVPGATLGSYTDGTLENWTPGALTFNGSSTYAVVTDADMKDDYLWRGQIIVDTNAPGDRTEWFYDGGGTSTYYGVDRQTLEMNTNSFLIEIVFESGLDGQEGVLASKLDAQGGYRLALDTNGIPELTLRSGGSDETVTAGTAIADGEWTHLLVEVDRTNAVALFHIDGVTVSTNALTLGAGASLTNSADFYVGKDSSGNYFEGKMDFLRLSQGTLADAQTDIDELYEWEFNGPFLRDFTGATAVKRDGGAIDSGLDALIQTSVDSLIVPEESTASFTVWLNAQPLASTTVTVARVDGGDADLSVQSGASLVFTTNNWNTPQTITLAAAADVDDLHGSATFRCSAPSVASVDVLADEMDTGAPQMVVSGNGSGIENGDNTPTSTDGTAFGMISMDVAMTNTFEITNEGGGSLVFTNILLSDDSSFTLLDDLSATSLTNGQSASLRVLFSASSATNLLVDGYFTGSGFVGEGTDIEGNAVDSGWQCNNYDHWGYDTMYNKVVFSNNTTGRNIGQLITGPGAEATNCTLKVWYKVADTTLGSGPKVHVSVWGYDGSGDISTQEVIRLATASDPDISGYTETALVNTNYELSGTGEDYSKTPRAYSNLNLSAYEYIAVRLGMDSGGTGDAFDEAVFEKASLEMPGVKTSLSASTDVMIYSSDVLRTPYTFALSGSGGNPEGDDDGDGLPNSWESQYYGSATAANTNDMASNAVNTVLEAYIAGLDPTDENAAFTLSNVRNILSWSMATGRVYTIYWTSNLLNSFQLLESNFTGGAYTDETHSAHGEGFYKIEVELE